MISDGKLPDEVLYSLWAVDNERSPSVGHRMGEQAKFLKFSDSLPRTKDDPLAGSRR